jgi:gas vesicle protein
MRRITGFLAGLLSGAVVGAVSALLLAPMSGRELQAQTREQFEGLMDDARSAAETKRLQLEAQLNALKAPKPSEEHSAA